MLRDSEVSAWIGTGKYVRLQHFWRKEVEIVSEHPPRNLAGKKSDNDSSHYMYKKAD